MKILELLGIIVVSGVLGCIGLLMFTVIVADMQNEDDYE